MANAGGVAMRCTQALPNLSSLYVIIMAVIVDNTGLSPEEGRSAIENGCLGAELPLEVSFFLPAICSYRGRHSRGMLLTALGFNSKLLQLHFRFCTTLMDASFTQRAL